MPQPITAAFLLLTHEKHREKLWLHFLPALTYHMQEGNLVWIKAFGFAQVMYPWASRSWQHLYWFTSWLVVVVVVGFSSGYVAPKGWNVICAIREAQHDPANYENPKQFNPWHHGQVHHSFCHPIRRYLHSTAQHSTEDRLEVPFHWQKKGLPN
jgi:hypothetical protein